MERSGVLPTAQLDCLSERFGSVDALVCVFHTLQMALESRQEARIVLTDFDRVTIREFSTSSAVNVELCFTLCRVARKCLGPLLFLPYTS